MAKLEEYAGDMLGVMIREVVRKYTYPLSLDSASVVGFKKYKQLQLRYAEDEEIISASLDLSLKALKNFVDSHETLLRTVRMAMLLPYDPSKVDYYHEQFVRELIKHGVELECSDGTPGVGLSFSMLDCILGAKCKEYQARFPDEIKEIMIGMTETFREVFSRMVLTEEEIETAGLSYDSLADAIEGKESP